MAAMYNWDKSDKEKPKRFTQNPSFSSCLLDEIYRSIDGGDENFGEFMVRKQKVVKKQSGGSGGRGRSKSKSAVEDEEIASFRQACLVEKWMEMKGEEKVTRGRRGPSLLPEFDQKLVVDNDPLFFSSGSSSSDSSFGWYSEAEAVKHKPSCFGPLNKVKTSVSSRCAVKNQQNGMYPFEDEQTDKTDDSGLVLSKTKALKFYATLKKVKQPISPGGRLTTFINAIFTNGQSKKSKDLGCEVKAQAQTRSQRKSKSTNVSTCSSASSFSRSCLNKNTPRLSDHLNNGVRRTVRFLDREDSRPYGQKKACDEQAFEKIPRTTFAWQRTDKPNFNEVLRKYENKKIDLNEEKEEDDDEDDMASDSSSDLFELDHLVMLKNEQYGEELPVYETTHLGTNRAIASGLVC